MEVKSESEVAQSCPTLSDPMDCSPPGSSVHGTFQARVLEWAAMEDVSDDQTLTAFDSRQSHTKTFILQIYQHKCKMSGTRHVI